MQGCKKEKDQGQVQEVHRRSICVVREKKQAVKKERAPFLFQRGWKRQREPRQRIETKGTVGLFCRLRVCVRVLVFVFLLTVVVAVNK